jgi:tripartite-type tricarboxylate transporter receptor subunit TctC
VFARATLLARLMSAAASAIMAGAGCALAQAQSFPGRPIRLIVAIAPGGAPDLVARVIADKLAPALGQPVVVENKSGANGYLAAETVSKARPDGHTLLLGQDSLFVINPHLYKSATMDPARELVPVSTVASNMFVLTLNPAVPAKNLAEFIEYARKANPPLHYASAGNGSAHHLAMEMLKQRAAIELTHVPYKSGAPATLATLAGETAAMFAGTSNAAHIKAGKLRAIAVTGLERSDQYPELPSIADTYPGFEVTIWLGIFAPAGIPAAITSRLREATTQALAAPDVKERFQAAGGLRPLTLKPAEFSALIERDSDKYKAVIRQKNLAID